MKTVTGRGYIRAGLAIAVTMAMVWGMGAAAGTARAQDAITRVLSSTGADITHIGAALLLLLTVGSMLVAMVLPGRRRGDGARE